MLLIHDHVSPDTVKCSETVVRRVQTRAISHVVVKNGRNIVSRKL